MMNWRARMRGYCPTWAEIKMDVYLGLPEDRLACELAPRLEARA